MTQRKSNVHGKIEHELRNGDVLIRDATRTDAKVNREFEKAERTFKSGVAKAYRELQERTSAG